MFLLVLLLVRPELVIDPDKAHNGPEQRPDHGKSRGDLEPPVQQEPQPHEQHDAQAEAHAQRDVLIARSQLLGRPLFRGHKPGSKYPLVKNFANLGPPLTTTSARAEYDEFRRLRTSPLT